MPGLDFQAIRAAVSISQVLELLGFVASEQSGDQVRGPCPVHGSTSLPSLAAVAAIELSPRRKPWVTGNGNHQTPVGAREWRIRRAPLIHRATRRPRGAIVDR